MRPTRKVWLLNVENLRTPDLGVLIKDEALSGIVSCSQAIGSKFQFLSGVARLPGKNINAYQGKTKSALYPVAECNSHFENSITLC